MSSVLPTKRQVPTANHPPFTLTQRSSDRAHVVIPNADSLQSQKLLSNTPHEVFQRHPQRPCNLEQTPY